MEINPDTAEWVANAIKNVMKNKESATKLSANDWTVILIEEATKGETTIMKDSFENFASDEVRLETIKLISLTILEMIKTKPMKEKTNEEKKAHKRCLDLLTLKKKW